MAIETIDIDDREHRPDPAAGPGRPRSTVGPGRVTPVGGDDAPMPLRAAVQDGVVTGPALATEDGSMVSEYGLVAVLGATIAGLAISWAKGGAVASLLAAVLRQLRTVVLA